MTKVDSETICQAVNKRFDCAYNTLDTAYKIDLFVHY